MDLSPSLGIGVGMCAVPGPRVGHYGCNWANKSPIILLEWLRKTVFFFFLIILLIDFWLHQVFVVVPGLSSPSRDWTGVSSVGRWILNQWTSGKSWGGFILDFLSRWNTSCHCSGPSHWGQPACEGSQCGRKQIEADVLIFLEHLDPAVPESPPMLCGSPSL